MYKIFHYIFIVFLSLHNFALADILSKKDSLLNEINKFTEDTAIVLTYLQLGEIFEKNQTDSALYYYNKAYEIASLNAVQKSDTEPGFYYQFLSAKSLCKTGYILLNNNKYPDALKNYLNAIDIYQNILKSDYEQLTKLSNIEIGQSYFHVGGIYINQGNFKEAKVYFDKSIEVFTNNNNKKGLTNSYRNLGIICYYKGDYAKSVELFFEALKIAEQIDEKEIMALVLNNLGGVNQKQGNYETSLEYYYKSMKIRKDLGDTKGIASLYNNIGVVLRNQKKHTEAIEAYLKSLKMKKELNDEMGIAISHVNIGNVYEELKEFEKAIKYFNNSLEYFANVGDLKKEVAVIGNIAKLYNDTGNHKEAIAFATKGLNLARENNLLPQEKFAYEHLSEAYIGLENYKIALDYFQKFTTAKDSLYNIEKDKVVTEMETKYQTEKKEKEIEILNNEKAIGQLKIRQKSLQVVILVIAIILLLIISSLFILRKHYRQKQLLKDLEIKEGKLRTKAIIDTQEKERERIARDLHDGIGQLLSAASLYFSKLSEDILTNIPDKKENYDQSIKILNDACSELRIISHQMMPRVLINDGLIPAMEDMLSISFSKTKTKYNFETFSISGRLKSNIEVVLFRISQELVNNILKHAQATEVSVQLFKNKNMIILMIEDDGKGICDDHVKDGIGLRNIISRADTVNGSFNIEKSPNKGTIATVRIPESI
ncbi:tetratricopeptide repeat protein [Bacteroidota bacterium]